MGPHWTPILHNIKCTSWFKYSISQSQGIRVILVTLTAHAAGRQQLTRLDDPAALTASVLNSDNSKIANLLPLPEKTSQTTRPRVYGAHLAAEELCELWARRLWRCCSCCCSGKKTHPVLFHLSTMLPLSWKACLTQHQLLWQLFPLSALQWCLRPFGYIITQQPANHQQTQTAPTLSSPARRMTRGAAAGGVMPYLWQRREETTRTAGHDGKLGNPLRCPLALIEQNVTALRRQRRSFDGRKRNAFPTALTSLPYSSCCSSSNSSIPPDSDGGVGGGECKKYTTRSKIV